MTLLGPRLTMPFVAAVILAVYAVCYGLVLLLFSYAMIRTAPLFGLSVAFLYFLAATPFIALSQITRYRTPNADRPVRPILMTAVMLAPALFWGYMAQDQLGASGYRSVSQDMLTVAGCLVPALLSLWLAVTFGLIAYQNWRQRA